MKTKERGFSRTCWPFFWRYSLIGRPVAQIQVKCFLQKDDGLCAPTTAIHNSLEMWSLMKGQSAKA